MELNAKEQQEIFGELALVVALRTYQASITPGFGGQLYEAYRAEGLPLPTATWEEEGAPEALVDWLTAAMDGLFESVTVPPVWLGEPHWPFFQGAAMTFVHQFSMPETDYEPAGQIYVFSGARVNDEDDSFTVVYKMIKQTPGDEGSELLEAIGAWEDD